MRIFIASSSELNEERDKLELLLYRENFKPVKWEDIDHSITTDRFQSRINESHLLTSDIVIFMIKSRLGEYTFEEFQESYKNLGLNIDKIYIYFFEIDKNLIPKKELRKIMDLEDFLEDEGKLYHKVKDFRDLENHFLKQIKHLQSTFTKDVSNENLKKDISSQQIINSEIKKICIYTASPLNTSIEFNLGIIKNQFKDFIIELHHKILNEDSLIEHYEFDLCFIFTKTNSDKIIIEDEYFIQKSITLDDLSELIEENKVILVLDKNIENSPFQIKIAENDSQIKKLLASTIHRELKLEKGSCKFLRLSTKLPELIDDKNLKKFIGRNTDIENLVKRISSLKNENKILTIKGSGGIGKTTLISKVITEFASRGKFKDGIKFVQCEFIKDYEDFEHKISMAFDMTNALNFKTQLKEQINQEDENRLIILDNVETILHLENTTEIKEFIKFISDYSTIIITSREKLNEEFEFVYDLRELTTDEAEKLFLKFYELKNYDNKFLRTEILENMLNNNPLAIKLVTSNLPKNKNLQNLKDELDNNFFDITSKDIENMFEKESDLNIERTKSLFNSINYSYSRLNEKEKLALELLSLFPDGMFIEHFKEFYNKKEDKDKSNQKTMKKKIENFSDRDLKSLEDKSLIINTNEIINLQSIIGRFADYKFQNRKDEEKNEYYRKAYGYNSFLLTLLETPQIRNSISSQIFDNNKNNFLKCLDYIRYLEIDEDITLFIDSLCDYFGMSSSPNEKIIEKLMFLKDIVIDDIKKTFLDSHILFINYFYGNFTNVYNQIKKKYPLEDLIINKENISDFTKKSTTFSLLTIYGMEGYQYDEVKMYLINKRIDSSSFQIGEYNICSMYYSNNKKKFRSSFFIYELMLNTNKLDIKELKRYIQSLYKTQFIDKMQSTYTLLKADKNEVTLKDIKKLIITNPFTDGLKTFMLAIKDEKNCSKEMYEEAIKKLFHIKYYHVEAILLYCKYLKENNDEDFQKWFVKGKDLASKHYYRYLLHRFNCLENNLNIPYDENDYPLPEKLDYSEIIKKYEL
ncbi:NB-ARC domain-containing protein [Aliarcobacter butzleri]|uniref:NB-ARC domain-containing protein n=1 Tax=Aliarcobacter butzleri TaxID=28197 RepID=UPI002B24BEF0|nr:NB-ARC domain-containing protein [Aliarcobacter butzleri]